MVTPSRPRPTTSSPVMAPGLEGDAEPGADAVARGLGGAHVGAHRDVHADIAGHPGQHRADQEADGDAQPEQEAEDDQDDDPDHGDGGVLPVQIGARAFLDGARDLLHPRRAGIRRQHLAAGVDAVDERQQAAGDDDHRGEDHSGKAFLAEWRERRGIPRLFVAGARMKAGRICQKCGGQAIGGP